MRDVLPPCLHRRMNPKGMQTNGLHMIQLSLKFVIKCIRNPSFVALALSARASPYMSAMSDDLRVEFAFVEHACF